MESPSVSNPSADEDIKVDLNDGYVYRLDLAYIGTTFLGWQSQVHGNTVQDVIEKALQTALREKVRILGASRTDTGVHAEHQVARFKTKQKVDCHRLQRSLEALLPDSLGVYKLRPVSPNFHPIVHAESKLYRYRIWQGSGVSPFARPFVWNIPQKLELAGMRQATQTLIGRHNFKSFCASDGSSKTFERTIFEAQWIEKGQLLEFYILGDGFLKQMIRTVVGTLVEVGTLKRTLSSFEAAMASQSRLEAGQTAPAVGLSLVRIFYEPMEAIPRALLEEKGLLSFNVQEFDAENAFKPAPRL